MANEWKHVAVGTELTQAEYEGTATHVFNDQAVGDMGYASTTSQFRRLAIGSSNQILATVGGVPAWSAQTIITSTGALNAGSITSGFGTINNGSSTITTTGAITGGSLVGTLGTAAQGNITSLGTLTTLTVDNVIINGTTIGHTSDSDLMTLADGTVNISGKISINDSSPGQTFSLTELAETNIIYQRTYSDTTGQHNKYYFIKSHSDLFETNATTLDTEIMGEFKYYGVNGAGTPAQTEVANIKVQQQGTAGSSYNASDIIFSTSTASAALAEKMRLSSAGILSTVELDISGDVDIDGTTNLDAVDIDGNVQLDGTFTVGVDDDGKDVKFFGETASAYMLWDESVDDLLLSGEARMGIGTTNTAYGQLSIDAGGAGTRMVRLGGTSTTSGNLAYISRNLASGETDAPVVRIREDHTGDDQDALVVEQDGTGNILTLKDGGTEKFIVTDGGTVVIGNDTAVLPGGATPVYNQIGTNQNTSSFGITRFSADTGAPQIFIANSRGGSIGTNTFPLNNDGAGSIHWQSANTTANNLAIESAVLRVDHKANTTASGSTTDMAFWTANAATAAVAFTIHADKDATLVGTLTEGSDVAYKTNINTIHSALDKVRQMRGVSYDRVDTNTSGVGLVAQELENIAPELVFQGTNDSEKYKSVAYTKLTAYLVEAIKELSNKVKALEDK